MKLVWILIGVVAIAVSVVCDSENSSTKQTPETTTDANGAEGNSKGAEGNSKGVDQGTDDNKKDSKLDKARQLYNDSKKTLPAIKIWYLPFLLMRAHLPAFIQKRLGLYDPKAATADSGDAAHHLQMFKYNGAIATVHEKFNRHDRAKAYWETAMQHKAFADGKSEKGDTDEADETKQESGGKGKGIGALHVPKSPTTTNQITG